MVIGGVQTRSKRLGPPARGDVPGKKVRVVQLQPDSTDDDFVAPPLAFLARLQEDPVWKAPDWKLSAEEEAAFPRVKTRSPAGVLVDALKDLSFQQKEAIRDLGFSSLLEFNVSKCPPRLVYWLLSNFDGQSRSFDLGGGRSLALEERDVELVLGFPRGRVDMVKRDRFQISNLLQRWRDKFEKKRHDVTPAEISNVMVKLVDGGLWFKRFLYVGVDDVSFLYAQRMYFQYFDDVSRVRDLNWCKLLVDSLVETLAAWKSGRHKCFIGPAEFVALFYVDRVKHLCCSVPRVVPSFRGWDSNLLHQRELSEIRLGGFGGRVIEPPLLGGVGCDGGDPPQEDGDGGVGFDGSNPLPACRYGPKAGVQANVDGVVDVGADKVPTSPGLLATDHFELGSGIDVSIDAPGFVTPHEVRDLVGGHEGSTSIPSDGTACGAPLKSDRAIIPPYSSVSLLSRFDNISNEPVGSGMAHLPDLPEDAVVVNWLLGGAGVDMEDTVFSIDGREARWDDLLTLVPGSEIGTTVIDAWACLLNRREISRNSAALTRFFASTFTTLHTIVDTSHSREQRVKWFRERLLLDFKSCPHSDITKVDMIFFPILRREHYFLLCFDFRRYCLDIIDNASAPTMNKEKYGESLEDMQDMLSEFYNKVHNGRSILCAGLVPKRMQMAWCDSRNKIDCGVYLMRHMESFLGQGVLDWDCGLVKEEYSTLHKLRLQYMKELVVSEYNLHRGRNLSRAYQSIGGPIAS